MTKICTSCGTNKPLHDFYKDAKSRDGYCQQCKSCKNLKSKEYYSTNAEKILQRVSRYGKENRLKVRMSKLRCYLRKREELNRRSKEYRIANNTEYQAYKLKYIKDHPVQHNCQSKLARAVAQGKIKKGLCEICGSPDVEAHHEDYTKPLDVLWFCQKHHKELHILKRISLMEVS